MLQKSQFDIGKSNTNQPMTANEAGFYDVHLWEFPIMTMLKLLIIGECTAEPYVDASLTYISEVDPMWESDLLTLVLNPEAVVFANPIASMVCAADCVAVTAGRIIWPRIFVPVATGISIHSPGTFMPTMTRSEPVRSSPRDFLLNFTAPGCLCERWGLMRCVRSPGSILLLARNTDYPCFTLRQKPMGLTVVTD
jgi:hypothetical protein